MIGTNTLIPRAIRWRCFVGLTVVSLTWSCLTNGAPPADDGGDPATRLPNQEERQKDLLYPQLESLLRTKEGDLASQMIKARRQQDQFINKLSQCIALLPQDRKEEVIAEEAALLLARYRGPDVLFALSRSIDLRTDRYVTMRSTSAEGMIGFTEKRYPCVRSLIQHGEPAVEAILERSLPPDHKRSDLQLELAAYALLEICCPPEKRDGVYIPQAVRDELEMLAEERFYEVSIRGETLENSLQTLKRFLQEVEPRYYRHPSSATKYDLGPAKNSSVFVPQPDKASETK